MILDQDPRWVNLVALSDDTLAQFLTLLTAKGKNQQTKRILSLLSQKTIHAQLLQAVWDRHKELQTNQQIRSVLQQSLTEFSKKYYPQITKILPKRWGNGNRIVDVGIGLI